MRFAEPIYFLLLLPALVIYFLFILGWIGKEAAMKFSSVALVRKAGGKRAKFSRVFQGFLRLLVFIFLILALARPQTASGEDKESKNVIDIMLSLDVSGSMATLDFHPDNRLVAAKLEARRFIEGRPHDRMGLVIFSGQSVTQCPLTTDRQAILTLLDKIQLGMMEDGTAIGLGLATAVNRLKGSQAKSKVVILLTDGVNNAGEIDPLTASDLAKQFGIKVYTVGVGKEGEAFLPIQDPRFGMRMIRVQTEIDEKVLARIATNTGGQYFRAQNENSLREIFKQIDRLERTEVKVETFTHFEEHYFLFLWPALFFLLFEIFWIYLIRVRIP